MASVPMDIPSVTPDVTKPQSIMPFVVLTGALAMTLALAKVLSNRKEIMGNWKDYKGDPFVLFTAFLFKPDDDPRSPATFALDNFYDVISDKIQSAFSIFLEPVYKVFKLVTDALVQALSGIFNMRALLASMWESFNNITDIFMRRFGLVLQQLRMTFIKLYSAFQKSYGTAVASIYAGLSTISTMLSFMDLVIKIIIVILVVLVALVIFFIFVLWPFIPLILSVVGIIGATAFGGAVGGMADSFCFAPETMISTVAGPQTIKTITTDTRLSSGAVVTGVMEFAHENAPEDIYELFGVQVSAAHIVFDDDGMPCHVADHPQARRLGKSTSRLYCLITSDHRIPVISNNGLLSFADWEEISSDDDLATWYTTVANTLNPSVASPVTPSADVLHSEAVLSPQTRILTPIGYAEIRGIRPGDSVIDASGQSTKVTGVVRISEAPRIAKHIGDNAWISGSVWMQTAEGWKQPSDATATPPAYETWYSIFTESGTFTLCEANAIRVGIRDFSDIGATELKTTYDWVLDSLTTAVDEFQTA